MSSLGQILTSPSFLASSCMTNGVIYLQLLVFQMENDDQPHFLHGIPWDTTCSPKFQPDFSGFQSFSSRLRCLLDPAYGVRRGRVLLFPHDVLHEGRHRIIARKPSRRVKSCDVSTVSIAGSEESNRRKSVFQNVSACFRMFQTVSDCFSMFQNPL